MTKLALTTIAAMKAHLENTKISKKNQEELLAVLTASLCTSKGGRANPNPLKLDEDGFIESGWCKFHQRYEATEHLSITHRGELGKEKSKNECKAGIAQWHRLDKEAKKVQAESITKLMVAKTPEEIKEVQEIARRAEAIKASRAIYADKDNSPFDYDKDWADYREATKTKA